MSGIRDILVLSWIDPLAWTEPMKGSRWKNLLENERRIFQHALSLVDESTTIQEELTLAFQADEGQPFKTCDLQISGSGHTFRWVRNNEKIEHECVNLFCDTHGNVWDVADVGDGAEAYELRFWKRGSAHPVWRQKGVGPSVIVLGSRCFFLQSKNSLWYYSLYCINAHTGTQLHCLYEEKDPKWNLSLVLQENHTAYCVRENSGLQEVFTLSVSSDGKFANIQPLQAQPQGGGFFVLGGNQEYFATAGRGTDVWKPHGTRLAKWKLPTTGGIPEAVFVSRGLLITRQQGVRTIWKCSPTQQPVLLYSTPGEFHVNMWNVFLEESTLQIRSVEPGCFSRILEYTEQILVPGIPLIPSYGDATRYFANNVPYILVKPHIPVHHLLVIGYGAYGLPTALNTTRWLPLISRGWAIAFALVRGGGDDTMEWADNARTWRRENAINDFIAVIRAAQHKTAVSAKHTCIYGRSAGGILIGGTLARARACCGAVYGEVPYLDVLRTTTNPNLPLTRMEYDEFGNPTERLEDLVAIARFSPMEGIPPNGYPGCFILIRTGENDKEVFAYEPVKWILRTRSASSDTSKILAFGEKDGHFVGGSVGIRQKADDLALLLGWSSRKKSNE